MIFNILQYYWPYGVLDVIIPYAGAAQGGQMGTTLKCFAKIARDGADVGPFGTTYAEVYFRQLETR